jgi:multimeric flavodoxin WrbA
MLIVHGSARRGGNSSALANEFGKEAERSYTVEHLHLYGQKIHPCTGCDICKDSGVCHFNDDMKLLVNQFEESDAVCLASPVYWWGISAQAKAYVDRLYSIPLERFEGKRFYLIVTGSDAADGIQYRLIKEQFAAICEYTKMEFAGYLPVSADDDNRVQDRPEILGKARALMKEA